MRDASPNASKRTTSARKDPFDLRKICSYLQIAIGDGAQSSFLFNLRDFCTREHLYTGLVQNALKILSQNGYMTLLDEAANPARILFCVSRDDLYRLRVIRDDLDHIIRVLLRLYEGVFTDFRPIDETEIATWSGYTPEKVHDLLKRLWQLRVIRYIPSNRSPLLYMDEERLPTADLYISPNRTSSAGNRPANDSSGCSPMPRRKPAAAAPSWKPISECRSPGSAASATSASPANAPPALRRRKPRKRPFWSCSATTLSIPGKSSLHSDPIRHKSPSSCAN